VPFVVPAPLADIAERLQCPVCSRRLSAASGSLICLRGHSFDVARHGYVTLQGPTRRPAVGDDGAMVAARAGVQAAGHFEPLTAALTAEAYRLDGGDSSVVLDVGAGTGHHLSEMLGVLAQARGIALDASRDASRRAARAHRRVAAVRSDVWQQIPLGGATVDLALSVFAPRNGTELARVLRPGGALIVVTPDPGHLQELAMLHTLRIDPRKTERLRRQLIPLLRASEARRISWTLQLTRGEAEAMLRMGPAAQHLRPDLERRLAGLPARVLVTAAVQLWTLRRPTTRMRGPNRTAG
jgi:SAM-dependent methyltransferase